jgi:hypothetical protein
VRVGLFVAWPDPAYAESGLVTGCDAQGNQLAPGSS